MCFFSLYFNSQSIICWCKSFGVTEKKSHSFRSAPALPFLSVAPVPISHTFILSVISEGIWAADLESDIVRSFRMFVAERSDVLFLPDSLSACTWPDPLVNLWKPACLLYLTLRLPDPVHLDLELKLKFDSTLLTDFTYPPKRYRKQCHRWVTNVVRGPASEGEVLMTQSFPVG